MTCPYCLAFGAQPRARGREQPPRIFIQAYWEFEETQAQWLGFSPAVSGLLEASYQNWMADPVARKHPQVQQGEFVYSVDLTWMAQNRNPANYQRIRRVGVSVANAKKEAPAAGAPPAGARANGAGGADAGAGGPGAQGGAGARSGGADAGAGARGGSQADAGGGAESGPLRGTVAPMAWRELREELRAAKAAAEQAEAAGALRAAALEAEVTSLRERCEEQRRELERLSSEVETLRAAGARLARHAHGVFPGRLVARASDGALGRVSAVEGDAAAVAFPAQPAARTASAIGGGAPGWYSLDTLTPAPDFELLARPGSRVAWQEGRCVEGEECAGGEEEREEAKDGEGLSRGVRRGVVIEPLDGLRVLVLRADDGRRVARHLRDLFAAGCPADGDPLAPGDFARAIADGGAAVGAARLAAGSIADDPALCGGAGMAGAPPALAPVGVVLGCPAASGSPRSWLARFGRGGGRCGDGVGHTDLELPADAPPACGTCARGDGDEDAALERLDGACKLRRDPAAELVRPGAAVRWRGDRGAAQPPAQGVVEDEADGVAQGPFGVGVVYATHGDGTAVVDFFGSMGFQCNVAFLEAVDHVDTPEHDVLRLLSECLAWHELSAQGGAV